MTADSGRRPRARHWMLLLAVLLLVAVTFLPPLININRYQRRIADSISGAIGRPVHMSSVKLRLLPRPGFEIEELVVQENSAFGAEPMLHSSSVVASIRLISLWRGRLEIARIHFDEPSLNLVRNAQGQWNFGSVLAQASRIPNAPTRQRHAGGALRFPYIEASNARINFKLGDEKQPFSFLNSDLSVWLDEPDEWQLRFEAQPARTDLVLNMSETGLLRLEGSLRRSAVSLGEMPVNLRGEWSNAPLGEVSRMLLGYDTGWRGAVDLRAEVSGKADDAQIKARLRASGVHRVEFEPQEPLELVTTCDANYRHTEAALRQVTCFSPVGEGHLLLTGQVINLPDPQLALKLQIQHVPVAAAFAALRVVRNGFAPAVTSAGVVDGEFNYDGAEASRFRALRGQATVRELTLQIPGLAKPLIAPVLQIISAADLTAPAPRRGAAAQPLSTDPALVVQPFSMNMGAPSPLLFNARLTPAVFEVHVNGSSSVDRMMSLSKGLSIFSSPLNGLGSQGMADVTLGIQGPWLLPVPDVEHPLPAATVTGTLHLRNARLSPAFLASPLEIVTAQGALSQGQIAWSPLSLTYGKIHADGSFLQPIFCADPDGCTPHFDIHVDTLKAADLQSALLGGSHGQMIEQILERIDRHPYTWPSLEGRLRVNQFELNTLILQNAAAQLKVKGRQVTLDSVDAKALGGNLHMKGNVDASSDLPVYSLEGQVTNADASEIATLFEEKWGGGSINATAKLQLSGFSAEQLASSTEGKFHWDWTHGTLPVDAEASPELVPVAAFDRWTADGLIHKSLLTVSHSVLLHGSDEIPLAGTVSFARELQLHSEDPEHPLAIRGTLDRPQSLPNEPAAKVKPAAYHR